MVKKLVALLSVALLAAAIAPARAAVAAPEASGKYFAFTVIYFDSPGPDNGSNASVNGEYFTVKNITGSTHNIKGWTVNDRQHHRFTFPSINVSKGDHITVHTGSGSNTAHTRHWGLGYYVWNNDGDAGALRGPAGMVQGVCSYTSASDPEKVC